MLFVGAVVFLFLLYVVLTELASIPEMVPFVDVAERVLAVALLGSVAGFLLSVSGC